jgi:hypothetical protein
MAVINWIRRIARCAWRAVANFFGRARRVTPITWKEEKITARAENAPLVDPYNDWTQRTNFEYYGPTGRWLPVLIELREDCGTAKDFAKLVSTTHERWAANLRVPDLFSQPPTRLKGKPLRFLVALAKKEFLSDIPIDTTLTKWIKRFELGRATPTADLVTSATGLLSQPINYTGTPKVVTGVIDDGIAFAHDRFWSTDRTTRIEFFWDQLQPSSWLGTEYSKSALDQRMASSRYGSLVDEDEVYRLSGHVDHAKPGHKPLASRSSHGAHVMDLACYSPARPAPGELPIVAVQLPVATAEDTSGATLGPQIFIGLFYIVLKADAIASAAGCGPLPVVANVSYGTIAGPHDGKSLLEAAMDQLIELCDPPLGVVLPAGNNHLSRCHAEFSLAPQHSQTLDWRVLPDDWTESHLEIWLPSGNNAAPVTITITSPDGTTSSRTSPGTQQFYVVGSAIVGQASYYPPGYTGARAVLRLSLAPTGSPSAGVHLSPAGLWRVELTNNGKKLVQGIHAWIQRDDTAPGYKRSGRQSYFDDPAYRRYDDGGRPIEDDNDLRTVKSYVKRRHTINAIATGDRPLVIGGFRRSDRVPWRDSSSGPPLSPGRANGVPGPGPDAMFPSEDAPSHRGILGAGTRSGSCVAMNGTSVAAPLATRRIVKQVSTGSPPAVIGRTALFSDAMTVDVWPNKPTVERGGGGRIPVPVYRPRR